MKINNFFKKASETDVNLKNKLLPKKYVQELVIETHGQYERGELDAYSELDDDDDVFVVGEFSRMLSRITLKGMTGGDDDDYEIIGKDKALKIREEFPELKKYTRNDKLNVKYSDGTIVKDIKFKKVENDLKSGKCSIID